MLTLTRRFAELRRMGIKTIMITGDNRLTAAAIAAEAGVDRIFFETPRKDQQAWFIRHFGASVNLANIAPGEVMGVEALRLGLRADTAHLPR